MAERVATSIVTWLSQHGHRRRWVGWVRGVGDSLHPQIFAAFDFLQQLWTFVLL
jgi:hypothetical protein